MASSLHTASPLPTSPEKQPQWLRNFRQQLERRDREQSIPFKSLINAYTEAISREDAMMDEMDSLKENQTTLEVALQVASVELADFKSGGGLDRRKHAELQAKVDQLKEEQAQLYRQQNLHIQKLLEVSDQAKQKEAATVAIQSELEQAHQQHAVLQETIEGLNEVIEEKNFNLQLMQDELTALQLELLKTDDNIARLEEENSSLVARLMAKVNETADMLNAQVDKKDALASSPGSKASHCPSIVASSFHVEGKKEFVNTLVPTPSGDSFALCTTYPALPIHAFSDGHKAGYLWGGPKSGIVAGCFDASGDQFVGTTVSTGSANPSIFVWHVPSEKIRCSFAGHDGLVTGAAFLRGDDTKIATCSHDHTLRIFDIPRNLCLKTVETNTAINAVIAGPFGIITAHQDGTLSRWDERSGTPLATSSALHSRAIVSILPLAETDELITVSLDHSVKSIDLATLSVTQTLRHERLRIPSEGGMPSLSPDNKHLAIGSSNGSVFIWNRAWNNELETTLEGHDSAVVATAWSKSTGLLASADRSGGIKIWK